MVEHLDWYGMYKERWGDDIVEDAIAHPAKYARALIRKIYAHLFERGYLEAGDVVVDPFGGVALGALDAMRMGCHWVGSELEERFVGWGQENIELWDRGYGSLWPDRWGSARIIQGDSRKLSQVLNGAGVLVTSPPYHDAAAHPSLGSVNKDGWGTDGKDIVARRGLSAEYGSAPGQLASMKAIISSPPYINSVNQSDRANDAEARVDRKAKAGIDVSQPVNVGGPNSVLNREQVYGNADGQLGAMDEGSFEAVVSSPPYAESFRGQSDLQDRDVREEKAGGKLGGGQINHPRDYGNSEGQLATMKAVVSSPPYRGGGHHNGVFDTWGGEIGETDTPAWSRLAKKDTGYGQAHGQMEQMGGEDDFWTAARTIVDQCYLVLKDDAIAVWVVKRFVRDKQVIDFPDQWRQMCEAAGFETIEWIRAWFIEDKGTQIDLFGNHIEQKIERKSFFRRLYESKYPENSIDWEDVIIMRKREREHGGGE